MTICHNSLMSAKLCLNHICHCFDKPLFDDLNLRVQAGEVVAIVGASGVGKTTLFNIVAGLLTPSSGEVLIDGVNRTGQAGYVGYMLQKDLLLPFKSVYDNIALPLVLQKQAPDVILAQIEPKLSLFGLDGLIHKYPHHLSGGQRQRAGLLRTYLSNHHIMLLDEPFSALDFVTKNEMYVWFRQFQQQNHLTCLMITHDIDEACFLANRVYVLAGMPAVLRVQFDLPKTDDFLQSRDYLYIKQEILKAMSERCVMD